MPDNSMTLVDCAWCVSVVDWLYANLQQALTLEHNIQVSVNVILAFGKEREKRGKIVGT